MRDFRVIVTGNIGCGKSTATAVAFEMLKPYGFELFDFDAEVHNLYEDDRVRQDLMDDFDTTDRKTISDIVHANPEAMACLREIMDRNILNRIRDFHERPRVLYDIPLYFEYEKELKVPGVPYVICITAPEYIQIARVKQRNGWSEEKIRSVMAKQMDQQEKAFLSDCEIRNNYADVNDFRREVIHQVDLMLAMHKWVQLV